YGNFKEIADFLIKQGSKVNSIYRHIFTSVVERGSKELIELLLTHGVIVNADLGHGRTALMIAASKSNKEMIELLIEHGADVNSAISEQYRVGWDYISVGTTVLMEVVKNGSLEITKLLLEHGADVNAVNENGWSALTYAVNGGSKELVELLIAHGADINTDCNFTTAVKNKEMLVILLNNKLDVDKIAKSEEALSAAVDCSNKEAVELLINHGANVKTTALLNCHTIEIAKLLIDHGADVNVADEHGKTALIVAAENSNKEMIELLIKHSANVNAADESGYTALMFAAKHNIGKEIAKFLVERGADVNAKTKRGLTALILASDDRYKLDLVEFLLTHGADVNAAMDDGRTALMIAASRSNKEMLELLIDNGADINARTKLGETPLMWCQYSERNAVTLIEHGADVNAVNKQGTSTYEMFIDFYGKDSGIVEFLVQHGAKTNVHNLFIEAIKNNNTEEVLKFINNGANLNLSFHIPSGYTPLMMAAKYDSKEVAELLIEHGAKVNHEPIELDGGAYYFPLSAAAEWNAKNVAELLINHAASPNDFAIISAIR
ncbi:MAG: ankyrin repeat domain-containing protein, partial [Lachnospiraceae bacterium]|nr:ankyrin repeat domain-containing protein [Lachnospiraceae bacterium]